LPHSSLAAREPIAIKQQSPLDRASILAQAGTENQAAQTDTTMKEQFSLARFREEERRRRAAVVAEYNGDIDAMAGEILRSRRSQPEREAARTADRLRSD
jgi:hypothetical protein